MDKELDILFRNSEDLDLINEQYYIKNFIVIGSSRGLGAAIVERLLNEKLNVIGISKTSIEKSANSQRLIHSNNYSHLELDITSLKSEKVLNELALNFSDEPVCIIFNASKNLSDVRNKNINFVSLSEINRTTINGLTNILRAFENHLLVNGGVFMGISSFEALNPSFKEFKVAYPASKAYMDMMLRSLRVLWGERIKIVTVHVEEQKDENAEHIAKIILDKLFSNKIPDEINYPFVKSFFHKYVYRLIPDIVYVQVYQLYKKIAYLLIKNKNNKYVQSSNYF